MDFFSSPSVGFGWSRAPPNQLPTPIPHDLMNSGDSDGGLNIHGAEDIAFLPEAGAAGPSRSQPSPRVPESDVFMDDAPIPENHNRQALMINRRNRRANLDWDGNRRILHRLYIEEKRLLTETMAIMKKNYSFNAP
jgi:hypothetical protein